MAGIVTAVVGGAVIGAAGSYLAADKSADAIEGAAQQNVDIQKYIYDQNKALNDPFYQQGLAALPYLQAYTGVDMTAATQDRTGTRSTTPPAPGTSGLPTNLEQALSTTPRTAPSTNPVYRQGSTGQDSTGLARTISGMYSPSSSTMFGLRDAETAMRIRGDAGSTGVGDSAGTRYISESGRSVPTVPTVNLPSYQDLVLSPMDSWNYEQSPAYQAKYTLGMQELNKQLQARGLAPSAVGGNRATDLSRRLTADDYNAERSYKLGNLQDLYKSKYSENTDRYNRLLDQVKLATGASSSMGQAGNQYANQVGQSAMDAGQARAGFYSGLPGAVMNAGSTGLRAYDYGQNQGWWGNGAVTNAGVNAASTAYQPNMAPDYGQLYGL